MENRNNIPLVPATVTEVMAKLGEIRALLKPTTETLTKKERQSLPKMSDGTLAFVAKTDELVQANPELLPVYISGADLKLDAATVSLLLPVVQAVEALLYDLTSTRMLAGSEGYVTALLAYGAFQAAARAGQPAAQSAVDQLKPRFAKQSAGGKTKKPKDTDESAGQ